MARRDCRAPGLGRYIVRSRCPGRAKEVFDNFDKDKSGSLDANEFAALTFSLGGNFTKEEIDAAIKQLDTGAPAQERP